ncbi:hypothetical protein P9209_16940 [Prescottella defluvii]|nr:hypothetical protein P9209_16940 [Prescottella defluvii]
MAVFDGALDVANRDEVLATLAALADPLPPQLDTASGDRSVFMEVYAALARAHMQWFGTTESQLAAVAAKTTPTRCTTLGLSSADPSPLTRCWLHGA